MAPLVANGCIFKYLFTIVHVLNCVHAGLCHLNVSDPFPPLIA